MGEEYKKALRLANRIAKMSGRWPPSKQKRKAVGQWAEEMKKMLLRGRNGV